MLHLQESGIERLPLKQNFTEPVHTYLNLAMDFIIEGEMPETSELILKSEYAAVTFYPKLSKEIQQKHHLTELVDRMPAHMLRLDNY